MKKAKLTLALNKETVANLNSNEMNEVQGGTAVSLKNSACPYCISVATNCCPTNPLTICKPQTGGASNCQATCNGCLSNGTSCC